MSIPSNRCASTGYRSVVSGSRHSVALLVALVLLLSMTLFPVGRAQAEVGDRLVVAVNGTSYTQRQVEAFIIIRESLRADAKGPVPLVGEQGWKAALGTFTDEMILAQEAHRLGSFQPTEQMLRVVQERFAQRQRDDAAFRNDCVRLGIDDRTTTKILHSILRTEAYRRSKERQTAVAARTSDDEGAPKWFDQLKDRAVVRHFSGAEKYVRIAPGIVAK